MQGIILAGGRGTRLGRLTIGTNKHLLPIGKEPMIVHAFQVMRAAGIDRVLVVTNPEQLNDFANLTSRDEPPFNEFRTIYFAAQSAPRGIADAIDHGWQFCHGKEAFVLLGDNIFTQPEQFREHVHNFPDVGKGAHIWYTRVRDPRDYGVLELDHLGYPLSIEEKPQEPKSDLAVTGAYLLDREAWWQIETLTPSARGELEVTHLLRMYLTRGLLTAHQLDGHWYDLGRSVKDYYSVATRMLEE